MNYPSEYEAKEMICEYGRRLYGLNYVAGNEGNISCRISENEIYVTPTMESKGYLNPDMLVKMNLDGEVIGGMYRQSSETKMHLGLYRQNPAFGAVIHSHPPTATAFACRTIPVKGNLLPESLVMFGEEIPRTEFAMPGTEDVPDSVIPYALTHQALLLGNHGALTWAKTLKEAHFLMETLEQYCKIYLMTLQLGDCIGLPEEVAGMMSGYHTMMMENRS